MIYVDYTFDLSDNGIILDSELKLKDQENPNAWGALPEAWKEGDTFKLVTTVTDRVALIRINYE
jgi:hypothetical protein